MAKEYPSLILEDKIIDLYDYQRETLNIINAPDCPMRGLVVLATGLGKTVTMAYVESDGRILILSHRDELVHQPMKYFMARGISYGVEMASEVSHGETIISSSVQSLKSEKRLSKFKPDEFDIIIIDEAHHAVAPSYKKILDYFSGARKIIGYTATPQRGDGKGLDEVFDTILISRDLMWGIQHDYLTPIKWCRVSADFDMKSVKKSMGDFALKDLNEALLSADNAEVTAKAYMELCYSDNRPTLVFCPSIEVAYSVLDSIKAKLPGNEELVQMVTGKTPPDERAQILDDYKAGKVVCIVNVGVFTEGTDLPNTSAIICDRPTCSPSTYTQIVGRGTRKNPATFKKDCLVIDVVGKNYKKRHVCTAPSLFGLDTSNLSEKSLDMLSNGNLLDRVDYIKDPLNYSSSNFDLRVQMYDELLGKYVDMLNDAKINSEANTSNNFLKRISASYEQGFSTSDDEIDFNGVLFRITSDLAHYYRVQATYKGYITLSYPDALGRSVITYNIPEEGDDVKEKKYSTEPIPLSLAVDRVKEYLILLPTRFRCKWNKWDRIDNRRKSASDKQKSAIKRIYKDATDEELDSLNFCDVDNLFAFDSELKKATRQVEDNEKMQRIIEACPEDKTRLFVNFAVMDEDARGKVTQTQLKTIELLYGELEASGVKINLPFSALTSTQYNIIRNYRYGEVVINLLRQVVNENKKSQITHCSIRDLVVFMKNHYPTSFAGDYYVDCWRE